MFFFGASQVSGTLSHDHITAMYATPIVLVDAAPSQTAYVVESLEFFHKFSTLAYTGGGAITLQYSSGAAILVCDPAIVLAASSSKVYSEPKVYNGFDLASAAGRSLRLCNADGAFAGGCAANVLKYRIRYRKISLLT